MLVSFPSDLIYMSMKRLPMLPSLSSVLSRNLHLCNVGERMKTASDVITAWV